MLRRENNALLREYASETLVIEPWGKDSLRVRMMAARFSMSLLPSTIYRLFSRGRIISDVNCRLGESKL
jgi:hypothetical protein